MMDRFPFLQLLGRHKLAVAISVLLTAAAMAAIFVSVPTTYGAKASLVLFNPPAPPEPKQASTQNSAFQNPYARFGDLSVVVDILKRLVSSEPTASRLASNGLVGTYAVAANIDYYHGPIIDVTSAAPTAADATKSAGLVVAELRSQLTSLQVQQGTDLKYQIKSQTVVAPLAKVTSASVRLRKTLMAGALGVAITAAVAMIADARNKSRNAAPRVDGYEANQGKRRLHRGATPSTEPKRRPASAPRRPERPASAATELASSRDRLIRASAGGQEQ
jgi:hypothetical protein